MWPVGRGEGRGRCAGRGDPRGEAAARRAGARRRRGEGLKPRARTGRSQRRRSWSTGMSPSPRPISLASVNGTSVTSGSPGARRTRPWSRRRLVAANCPRAPKPVIPAIRRPMISSVCSGVGSEASAEGRSRSGALAGGQLSATVDFRRGCVVRRRRRTRPEPAISRRAERAVDSCTPARRGSASGRVLRSKRRGN